MGLNGVGRYCRCEAADAESARTFRTSDAYVRFLSAPPQEALKEILNVRSVEGEIDHSSPPVMARAALNRIEKINVRTVERTDPTGKVIQEEQYDVRTVAEDGRSLGAMITVLTEAVKGLNEKIEALQAENQILKTEIAALKSQ